MSRVSDNTLKKNCLKWLTDLSWCRLHKPDMEKKATELVLEQAEVLCKEWATS